MSDFQRKLSSRKFWICVAAFLGSVSTSIAGYQTGNETLAAVGMVCATISAAIYAAVEAYVDGKYAERNVEDDKPIPAATTAEHLGVNTFGDKVEIGEEIKQ